jgi:hypothetical protein
MLEQCQQRHRRKAILRCFRQQAQEGASRGVGQRAARGVVDLHAPASHFGGDPPRQVAVGRHQRGAAAGCFQCFA